MWNRFGICTAWYVFATHFHQGQWSPEYAIFGRLSHIDFKPGLGATEGDRCGCDRHRRYYSNGRSLLPRSTSGEYDNARYILAQLIRRSRSGWRPNER